MAAIVPVAGQQGNAPNTRPTIVVAIGGSGMEVVTDVKRALINAYGVVPPNVKLLAFDTVALGAQRPEDQHLQGGQDYFGRIRMDAGGDDQTTVVGAAGQPRREYHHVGRGVRISQVGDEVLGWFPRQRFISVFGDLTIAEGAGAHRSVGRAALFYDLEQRANSDIASAITTALRDVSAVAPGAEIQVVLVSSLTGGTGAGMATDMAVLLRDFGANARISLSAVLVLPDAFGDNVSEEARLGRARSYAAWREFGRMRLTGQAVFPYEFQYPNQNKFRLKEPIVDALYLVGGRRWNGAPMAPVGRPADHAFPAAAQFIYLLIDATTATHDAAAISIQTVAVNERQRQMTASRPLHATFGTWTERSVVLRAMRAYGKEVNVEWIKTVSAPVEKTQRLKDETVRYFEWAPDQNQEAQGGVGIRGSSEVPNLLRSMNQAYGDENVLLTAFVHDIGAVCYPTTDADVLRIRQALLGESDFAELEGRFIDRGGPDDVEKFRQASGEDDPDLARPSSQERGVADPEAWYDQVVDTLERKLDLVYGGTQTSKGGERTGSYGEALGTVRDHQVRLFRDALRLRMQSTLMGRDGQDFVRARAGKPGYCLDLLRQLDEGLQRYRTFLSNITQERNKLGEGGRPKTDAAKVRRDGAKGDYERSRHAKWLFWWQFGPFVSPSLAAQDEYRAAVDAWVKSRKEDLLLKTMDEAAERMQKAAHATVENMVAWQRALTGDPDLKGRGLYTEVEEEFSRSGVSLIRASAIEVQNVRVMDTGAVDRALLNRVLERIEWTVASSDGPGDGLAVKLQMLPLLPGCVSQTLQPGGSQDTLLRNLAAVATFAAGATGDLPDRARVLPRLMAEYQTGNSLAKFLLGQAEPMLQVNEGADEIQQWFSVKAANTAEQVFLNDVDKALHAEARFAGHTYLVGSDDSYAATYLKLYSGFIARNVASYATLRTDYWTVASKWEADYDPAFAAQRMHVLPAEQHALELELYLRKVLGAQSAEELDPRTVACLEDIARATLFLWADMLGYVEEISNTESQQLVVHVPVFQNGAPYAQLEVAPAPITVAKTAAALQGDSLLWVKGFTNFVNRGVRVELAKGEVVLDDNATVPYQQLERVIRYRLTHEDKAALSTMVLDAVLEPSGTIGRWRSLADNLAQRGNPDGLADMYRGLAYVSTVVLVRDCALQHMDVGLGSAHDLQAYQARLALLLQGRDPRV